MKYLIILLSIMLASTTALASEPLPIAAEPISMWSGLLRTSWALLVVIGLILCIYGLLRKRFGLGALQHGNIKVIEIKHIIPKSTLALVEINDKRLLLGVSTGNISLLADFTDTDHMTTKKNAPDFKTILATKQ